MGWCGVGLFRRNERYYCRAAERKQIETVFVANQVFMTHNHQSKDESRSIQASSGFDVGDDDEIVSNESEGGI